MMLIQKQFSSKACICLNTYCGRDRSHCQSSKMHICYRSGSQFTRRNHLQYRAARLYFCTLGILDLCPVTAAGMQVLCLYSVLAIEKIKKEQREYFLSMRVVKP